MTNTVQIGRRLIPLEHIALIEPYIASEQNSLKSNRPFQTRVVLIDRDSVLTEETLCIASIVTGQQLPSRTASQKLAVSGRLTDVPGIPS